MLKFALLGLLHYRPLTGYELKQIMDESTSNFWHAELSQIYATLKRLEQDGAVESHVEPQTDRPDRRVYNLTSEGTAALGRWLSTPVTELQPGKDLLLLKLFFSAALSKETVLTQLRLQRDLHRMQGTRYREHTTAYIHSMLDEYPHLSADGVYWEQTRRFGEMYEDMYVCWLDQAIQALEGAA